MAAAALALAVPPAAGDDTAAAPTDPPPAAPAAAGGAAGATGTYRTRSSTQFASPAAAGSAQEAERGRASRGNRRGAMKRRPSANTGASSTPSLVSRGPAAAAEVDEEDAAAAPAVDGEAVLLLIKEAARARFDLIKTTEEGGGAAAATAAVAAAAGAPADTPPPCPPVPSTTEERRDAMRETTSATARPVDPNPCAPVLVEEGETGPLPRGSAGSRMMGACALSAPAAASPADKLAGSESIGVGDGGAGMAVRAATGCAVFLTTRTQCRGYTQPRMVTSRSPHCSSDQSSPLYRGTAVGRGGHSGACPRGCRCSGSVAK